jgi:Na+-translocating ferredoxin:NAD+ oxidoreductase RnfG subunit
VVDLETLISAGLVRAIRPMTKNQLTNATRALSKSLQKSIVHAS